ncbi:MAG: IS66 family insertion sequence element accessory protein TnpB [Myxococcota bacterium]|nr:IS66 family insertion sequence element accessory protein TnpB [Myxococcota bacterium]
MIQITPQMRILVAVEPADFRKGIDGLAQLCRNEFDRDPFCGAVFVFRNKRKTAIKALVYDGQGFWLCQKRLSAGKFKHWPGGGDGEALSECAAHELAILLRGGNPDDVVTAPVWRKV